VRTGSIVGSDTYTPTLATGSLSTAPTSCSLSVQ
jgi:hypothetical protein